MNHKLTAIFANTTPAVRVFVQKEPGQVGVGSVPGCKFYAGPSVQWRVMGLFSVATSARSLA